MIVRLFYIIVALNTLICLVHCQEGIKGSLTFVIDSTVSMTKDIKSVVKNADQIFDAVVNSNTSEIDNFVIVTFNDPGFELRIKTNKKAEFKSSLNTIHAHGGGDCPEMAMSGIELGLKHSSQFSYLFVFTDARAKDIEKYERVKNLALDLNTKIYFVVTQISCPNETNTNYTAYETLANKTGGEFFPLKENKMPEILKYVKKLVESRKFEILKKSFKPDEEKRVDVILDYAIGSVLISVSGSQPTVDVKDKHNTTVDTEGIANTINTTVLTWIITKPGLYIVEINCKTITILTIYGTSKVAFSYGFSVIKPDYMNETTNRPVADQKSYILIKLKTEGAKLNLKRIQVVDLKDNLLFDKAMSIFVEGDQTYISEPLVFPKDTFKIVIIAEDEKTNERIKRTSLPIEPQKVLPGTKENEAPKVTIMGESEVTSSYGNPLQLTCRVTGYPKPKILWEDGFGSTLTSTVLTLREEYEFVSVLSIDKVNQSNTYICKANNSINSDKKSVEVKIGNYFVVVNISKDTKVEYNKEQTLFCKVNAYPPANVTWYLNGKEVKISDDISLSSDQSTLFIKKMKPKYAGEVLCEVRNNITRLVYNMQLSIAGIEVPRIDKNITDISVARGSSANILCRILKGDPKPNIEWYFKSKNKDTFSPINEYNEVIHIEKVTTNDVGTYKCTATNKINIDSHVVDLIMEYAPVVQGTNKINVIKKSRQTIKIPCEIKGEPVPDIKWTLNGIMIEDKKPYQIHKDKTLSFVATVEKMGQYICEGVNKLGSIRKTVEVTVLEPFSLVVPKKTTINTMVGRKLNISCSANGYPTPTIRWLFISSNGTDKFISSKAQLIIAEIQVADNGTYICFANNTVGETRSLAYIVNITAPPSNIPVKQLTAVVGDKVLRIPCESTGEPKPTISWIKNGNILTIEHEWYTMESDGTLVIKNVQKSSAGMYTCAAQNKHGTIHKHFKVNVERYPKKNDITIEEYLEENKSAAIQCSVPHAALDEIRWYKSQRVIADGETEIKFNPYTDLQKGLYDCRVSNFKVSTTGRVDVKTGFIPRFSFSSNNNLAYMFDDLGSCLKCLNSGQPKTKISWWKNKMRIFNNDMSYCYKNKVSSIGDYECVVQNKFGKISQQFSVRAGDCLLDIEADMDRYHPLVLNKINEFSDFYIKDGYLAIPVNESAHFFCEGNFNKFTGPLVKATCKARQTFEINKEIVDYRKLKCIKALQPVTKKTEEGCARGRGEVLQIGVNVMEFLEVYRVCLDKKRKIPLYAEHNLKASAAGVKCIQPETWFNSEVINYNKNEMYDCKKQRVDISTILGQPLPGNDDICFVARQLVNERDVSPGFPQILTHSYLNNIPHWNSDRIRHWDTLEEILRTVVKMRNKVGLTIRTGISQNLQLPTARSDIPTDIYIKDKAGNTNIVPMFLWKVITDTFTAASVAIIQVNIPDSLIDGDITKYYVCANQCDKIEWIKPFDVEYLNSGLIFCCSVYDFEKAFGYYPLFNEGYNKLLRKFES